jgi:hypothetical protein
MMLAGGSNVTQSIAYTVASGMKYLMYFASFWSTAAGPVSWGGHYNVSASWGGLPGLAAKVLQMKAAGLKAGMHTMAGTIDPTDGYVTPVPDPRLAKVRSGTLKSAVGLTDTKLLLEQPPTNLPGAPGYTPPTGLEGTIMQIGDEIISFATINLGQPALQGVTRGKFGTRPAAHAAGTPIHQMIMGCVGSSFLPAIDSDLTDEVAQNMIRVYAGAGFEYLPTYLLRLISLNTLVQFCA